MAYGFPKRIPSHATKGERKVYKFLLENLDETVVVYYEPNVRGKKPDILIISESLGIIVLEIKDYLLSNLKYANETEWAFNSGEVAGSPLLQARNYSFEVCNLLRKDPVLCDDKGKLKFNYSHGVVFTNITRMEFISHGLDELYPNNLVILKDDLDSLNEESLFEVLAGMKSYSNAQRITEESRDRIRFILFPEVRVKANVKYDEKNLSKFLDLTSMDLYQESMAREFHEGHRLIRGVAGSGKTLILIARAKLLLNEKPEAKILIICYSVTLKAYIKGLLGKEYSNIDVESFNDYMAKKYQVVNMEYIDRVEDLIGQGIVYRLLYDHILVDEAQDMEPQWIKFLFDSVKSEESSFIVCMDSAQNIFKRSIASMTGIDFRGRSTVLSKNYRNPKAVIDFAWKYYNHYADPKKNPDIINPDSVSKVKGELTVEKFDSYKEELDKLITRLKDLDSYTSVAIIYRVAKLRIDYMEALMARLTENEIPFIWTTKDKQSKSKFNMKSNMVNILTAESSKGLNFDNVFMIAFTSVHSEVMKDTDRHVRLSYIGLTRSLKNLHVSYHEENALSEGLVDKTKINSFM